MSRVHLLRFRRALFTILRNESVHQESCQNTKQANSQRHSEHANWPAQFGHRVLIPEADGRDRDERSPDNIAGGFDVGLRVASLDVYDHCSAKLEHENYEKYGEEKCTTCPITLDEANECA